jgi:hypothetical protein
MSAKKNREIECSGFEKKNSQKIAKFEKSLINPLPHDVPNMRFFPILPTLVTKIFVLVKKLSIIIIPLDRELSEESFALIEYIPIPNG